MPYGGGVRALEHHSESREAYYAHFAGVYFKTRVTALRQEKTRVRVAFAGQADLSKTIYDRVLVAIGRQPSTANLGLKSAGVQVDAQGYVVVDRHQRTTNERLFAIGDVAGGMLLAHKAMYEGRIAAEVIAGQRVAFDARAIPAVVYTEPQIAWCGLTENDVRVQDFQVKVGRFPWKASGRAMSIGPSTALPNSLWTRHHTRYWVWAWSDRRPKR
jgi:dihydrolipoamide dehydrogenase